MGWVLQRVIIISLEKDNTVNNVTIKNNDFGVVPVAALFRYYPEQTGFYLGTDFSYGFIVGDDKVAENASITVCFDCHGGILKNQSW